MTREEAIDILCHLRPTDTTSLSDAYATGQAVEMAIQALKQNESAEEWYKLFVEKLEQEPKTGHWIDREVYDADRWKCSECGRTEPYKENYYPNCVADMRGDKHG